MTASVTEAVQIAGDRSPLGALPTDLGIVVLVLLMVLLLQRELLRVSGRASWSRVSPALDVATVPLLFAASLIFALRFGSFLGLV